MEAFVTYFNALTPAQKVDFAKRCDTTVEYFRKVVSTRQQFGEKLCIAIERETDGEVRCEQIRDDVDWNYLRGTRKRRSNA